MQESRKDTRGIERATILFTQKLPAKCRSGENVVYKFLQNVQGCIAAAGDPKMSYKTSYKYAPRD